LRYYDLVAPGFEPDPGLVGRLGFEKVFSCGKDIAFLDSDSGAVSESRFVCAGYKGNGMMAAIRNGASAIVPLGLEIERKVAEYAEGSETVVCVPVSRIISGFGFNRLRNIGRAKSLLRVCRKYGTKFTFVTFAENAFGMLSYMQVIEIAKMLGASESEARAAVSIANRLIVTGEIQ
jgi:hypothetical protein